MSTSNASILKELWTSDIAELMVRDNSFLKLIVDDSGYGQAGIYQINRPQGYGDVSTITVNNQSFPVAATTMTDTVLSYTVDVLQSAPRIVSNALITDALISYDKRSHILKSSSINLLNRAGDRILYKIAKAINDAASSTNVFLTSGSGQTAAAPGLTGVRNQMLITDFLKVLQKAKYDNVNGKLIALLPPQMSVDILKSVMLTSSLNGTAFAPANNDERLRTGMIGTIYGVECYERSNVALIDSGLTTIYEANDQTYSGNTTACEVGIVCSADFVTHALFNYDLFISENRAEYFGTLLSTSCYVGGSLMRTDAKGAYLIVAK
jgi:hypothetical protein